MCVRVVCENSCMYACVCVCCWFWYNGENNDRFRLDSFSLSLSSSSGHVAGCAGGRAALFQSSNKHKSGVERESNFSIFSARLVGREKSRVQSLPSKSLEAGLLLLLVLLLFLVNIWCEQQRQHNILCCFSLSFLSLFQAFLHRMFLFNVLSFLAWLWLSP